MVSERYPTGDSVVPKSAVLSMRLASTHGPKYPREQRFPPGEGEPASITGQDQHLLQQQLLQLRVGAFCPSIMVMSWGTSTSPLKRWDHQRACVLLLSINIKHSHGWKVLLVETLHDMLHDFLVEDCKIQTFFLMELLEHFLRVSKAV